MRELHKKNHTDLLINVPAPAASGVMSFLINRDGGIFQRIATEGAQAITAFNRDDTWKPVK